jgi:hypothetical protein
MEVIKIGQRTSCSQIKSSSKNDKLGIEKYDFHTKQVGAPPLAVILESF